MLTKEMSPLAKTIFEQKYSWKDEHGTPTETWDETAERVVFNVLAPLCYDKRHKEYQKILQFIQERKFIPGGRYLYAAGRSLHQVNNCLLLKAEDSREGWAELLYKSTMALQTGAGIGIDYSGIRPSGSPIKRTGGVASGPMALMNMVNEIGRGIMQGGARRSAIWAGLKWSHPDCVEFIRSKDWSPEVRELKDKDFTFPAPMELTNISVLLDDEFFQAYEDEAHPKHLQAKDIYWLTVCQMVKKAEPGFSINTGENSNETLRNACTELTSEDDSDICNLGSINLARVESIEELEEVVKYSTLFLLAGTVYSDVPYVKVYDVRTKNRRLGLGVMGLHEWLLSRGYSYGPNEELGEWLEVYSNSGTHANYFADRHALSHPVKTRAIAPTGTIGIVAETTTGIEPIFCVAYKRRYLNANNVWNYQYVIDPTARRIIDDYGVEPSDVEDAYMLSYDVERRVAFQAWVQKYVDHSISSTINLPYPITKIAEQNDFGRMLYKYLPQIRGITCYPDGARGGQPISAIPYEVASEHEGVVFETEEETCIGGVCGV